MLCVGLHPNVCVHKEKRHVLTSDKKIALIHKSSVNIIYKHPSFPSPYLIFEEKVRSQHISQTLVQTSSYASLPTRPGCEATPMLAPLTLILIVNVYIIDQNKGEWSQT